MLDPKEQAKGGFRAQLERARERDLLTRAESDASATDPSAPPDGTATPPSAPGAGRQPKRWH